MHKIRISTSGIPRLPTNRGGKFRGRDSWSISRTFGVRSPAKSLPAAAAETRIVRTKRHYYSPLPPSSSLPVQPLSFAVCRVSCRRKFPARRYRIRSAAEDERERERESRLPLTEPPVRRYPLFSLERRPNSFHGSPRPSWTLAHTL